VVHLAVHSGGPFRWSIRGGPWTGVQLNVPTPLKEAVSNEQMVWLEIFRRQRSVSNSDKNEGIIP